MKETFRQTRDVSPSAAVRLPVFFTTLALTCACGESVAPAKTGDRDEASTPRLARPVTAKAPIKPSSAAPEPLPEVQVSSATVERAGFLGRFFQALAKLESQSSTEDVRVVQFGDSHTAADFSTAVVRRALQKRFGDGGRGFVSLGAPYKGYIQDGVRAGLMQHFEGERGKHRHGAFTGDGMYGLLGYSVQAERRGARISSDFSAAASRIELAYLERPGGGSFEVLVDGAKVATVDTKKREVGSAWKTINVPDGPHNVEVRTRSDSPVRIFGAALDRAPMGVVYDALGINGARASGMKDWDEAHFAEQLRHRAPHLVVLAFGTNESADDASMETHERHLVDVLGRVARAVPTAACLVLGPPDRAIESGEAWVSAPRVREIVAMQRRVTQAAGCAYFDMQSAIGGEGTMARWASEDPPKAQRDRVHYTRDSYAFMGQLFARELLAAYDVYLANRKP
jgi:lysophospholipase L1-like esterase